jgi:cbb3-type cytochrome oxidase subunit 3
MGIPRSCGHNGNSGSGTVLKLNKPYSIVGDNAGTLFVADAGNNMIRQYSLTTKNIIASWDGTNFVGANSAFNFPTGLTYNELRSFLYIAEKNSNTIRKVNVANSKSAALHADHVYQGDGTVNAVTMRRVKGISINKGNTGLFVADTLDRRIYAFSPLSASLTSRRLEISSPSSLVSSLPAFFATFAAGIPAVSAVDSRSASLIYLTIFLVICVCSAYLMKKRMNKKSSNAVSEEDQTVTSNNRLVEIL